MIGGSTVVSPAAPAAAISNPDNEAWSRNSDDGTPRKSAASCVIDDGT
jgi:hypothetical protein